MRRTTPWTRALGLAAFPGVLGLALPAAAHPAIGGAHGAELLVGMAHPLLGLDHLLAMVAVGLWAARSGVVQAWRLPVAFLLAMAAGIGAGLAGAPFPTGGEFGIAASVLVLGFAAALALGTGASVGWASGLAAAVGLIHGLAHGTEAPGGVAPLAFAAGVLIATAALHVLGLGLGLMLRRLAGDGMARASGVAIGIAGALLVVAVTL